ncbi:hypothetical protein BT96DRAFT_950319 [Gymnopus androsaceus JB14]|uniref:Uncharacterized protein n=1 Tax=Gymnopus androsaceus JB14 TaxID=1447944 RepID=A0A6A4GGY8_9AGAR|nr:hypothetical protein BT96DRAFT_950319 [Gymnopus androsaceus JB14]
MSSIHLPRSPSLPRLWLLPLHTAAVSPVIKAQHSLSAGQTSGLNAGRSGLSSSTLPAVFGGAHGAAGPLQAQAEWFIEESFLTYTFISGDEIPGLSSPVVMPPKLISEGLVNYHQFVVDFELSMTGLGQDKFFPEEAIFISDLTDDVVPLQIRVYGFSPSKHLFDPSKDTLVNNMFIDFKAKESEKENPPDNAQEEEEEEADDNLSVGEESVPHVDHEVEFLGKAVKQAVPACSSMLKYPTLPVPKPISSSAYTSICKKGQTNQDKDSGFPQLEGGHPNILGKRGR